MNRKRNALILMIPITIWLFFSKRQKNEILLRVGVVIWHVFLFFALRHFSATGSGYRNDSWIRAIPSPHTLLHLQTRHLQATQEREDRQKEGGHEIRSTPRQTTRQRSSQLLIHFPRSTAFSLEGVPVRNTFKRHLEIIEN